MIAEAANHPRGVLNSWKEIARYLDRGVRTVQRWEADLGLPVRRIPGRERSPVLAFCAELDAWLKSCPVEKRNEFEDSLSFPLDQQSANGKTKHTRALTRQGDRETRVITSKLINESQRIRKDATQARSQLVDAVMRLQQTVGKMLVDPDLGLSCPRPAEVVSSEDAKS